MIGRVAYLRVRSSRAPYRRGGVEFGNLPLMLGPEHFEAGIVGLRQLSAVVNDPVLTVKVSDVDTPDQFENVPQEMRDALAEAVHAFDVAEDKSSLNEAAAVIVGSLLGSADDESDDEHARLLEAKRLADDAEEKRLADEAEAKRLADEAEAKRLADEAEAKRLADEAEAKRLADEAAATEPKKGDAAPTEAKAKANAKPQGSSGRQSKPATTTAAKG